jgi:mannosylglycerate synthase
VARTLLEAQSHPAVELALGIHGNNERVTAAVEDSIKSVPAVRLIPQARIGALRPGKGDAINTGFRFFLDESRYERLHFYDADIKTFHRGWIERAESALDLGFDAVRHFYPRSPTDGMITWMVTKPGFGLLWPNSVLPRIQQPMAGEIAFSRSAAAVISGDRAVSAQSDWGIDTAITHRTVGHGLSIYETFAPEGKDHQLYGSLDELKTMFLECLHTLQRLRTVGPPMAARHEQEPTTATASPITERIAYDIEASRQILGRPRTADEQAILDRHFDGGEQGVDTRTWLRTLRVLLDHFQPASPDWHEVAYRLWIERVISHSDTIAEMTYEKAMMRLTAAVDDAVAFASTL